MEHTTPPEVSDSPHKVCCACGLEIRPGEGHATHDGKHWHYGLCYSGVKPAKPAERKIEIPAALTAQYAINNEATGASYGIHAEAVYSPKHYTQDYIETIYVIRQVLGEQGFKDFCMGNYIKYRERHTFKNGGEDLKKAEQYLEWATNGLPEPVNGRVPR